MGTHSWAHGEARVLLGFPPGVLEAAAPYSFSLPYQDGLLGNGFDKAHWGRPPVAAALDPLPPPSDRGQALYSF